MAPLTTGMLSSLKQAIDKIPKQDNPFRNQTASELKHRSKERNLFRKLLAKLAGADKDNQVAFLVTKARRICSKTYMKVVLESIPNQPDYLTIEKKNRQTFAPVHSLIDEILRIAAGSGNIVSQKKIFESRWEVMHKELYVATSMTVRSIIKVIEEKFGRRDERIDFYLVKAREINIKSY